MKPGKISGEQEFQSIRDTFTVGGSTSPYYLAYSADKTNWSAWPTQVPEGETLIVNGCTPYTWFKLSGNTGENIVVIL